MIETLNRETFELTTLYYSNFYLLTINECTNECITNLLNPLFKLTLALTNKLNQLSSFTFDTNLANHLHT